MAGRLPPLEAAVRRALRRGGTTGTPAAELALALAREIDSCEQPQALAALAAQLRQLLPMLESTEAVGTDVLDELRRRRDARGA